MRIAPLYVIVALLVIITAGCDKGGGGGADPDPTYTKVIHIKEDNQALTADVIKFSGSVIAEHTSATKIERTEGTSGTVTAEKAGYVTGSETVTFNRDGAVTIQMKPEAPDAATFSYEIMDEAGAPVEDGQLFIADTLAGGASGSLTFPLGTSFQACAKAAYHEDDCRDVTISENQEPVNFEVARTFVTVTVTPEIGEFTAIKRGEDQAVDDFTSYELTVDGETFTNVGPDGALLQESVATAISVPAGDQAVTISGRFIYVQESREYSLNVRARSLAVGEIEITPNADQTLTLTLVHQPACSDKINNDADSSNLVDGTDGGCVANDSPTSNPADPDWKYDPTDDEEGLLVFGKTFNFQRKSLYFVSSKDGERQIGLLGNIFPEAIRFAVGEVPFWLDNKIEKAQTGESFAIEIDCPEQGSDPSTRKTLISDIVADNPDIDGWRESRVHGITNAFFQNTGVRCNIALQHGSLARGESPGDGNDDVVISTSERAVGLRYEFATEPESLPAGVTYGATEANGATAGHFPPPLQ